MRTVRNTRNKKATIVSPEAAKARSAAEANLAKFPLNFQMAIRLLAAVAMRNVEKRRQLQTAGEDMTTSRRP